MNGMIYVATGTQVTNWIPTSVYSGEDEGKAGPFNLDLRLNIMEFHIVMSGFVQTAL